MSDPQVSGAGAVAAPVSLFYSYAHKDEALRDELQGHLKILELKGLLAPWHDRKIPPGADWSGEIDANLRTAELILLLVSSDFMASKYIHGVELAEAMKRQQRKEATVVPVIVRPVDLAPEDADALPFLKLQALPTDMRPVTTWPNRDEAWVNVAKGLRSTVKLIRENRPPAATPPIQPAVAPTLRGMPAAPSLKGMRLDADQALPAPAAAAPDPVLQRVVDGVVARVQEAMLARGERPLDGRGVGALEGEALSLIGLPEARRVLWVDDNPENNVNETSALSRLQIEVVAVRSTDEAMRRLAEDREGFDLVISDWSRRWELPGAALALLRRLRAEGHTMPVVIYHACTGAKRMERADKARAAGAFGEAVLPGELLALVGEALKAA